MPGQLRKLAYTDLAMTPVSDDEAETHELFNSDAARAFVGHEQHLKDVRRNASGVTVPAAAAE